VDDSETLSSSRVWPGRNGTACCPNCNKEHKNPSIQDCSDALVAIGELLKRGKAFRCHPKKAMPSSEYLDGREKRLLQALNLRLPESRLPKWSGIVNPAIYGMETHSDFLNKRQRLVLLELIGGLNEERALLEERQSAEVARYVISA